MKVKYLIALFFLLSLNSLGQSNFKVSHKKLIAIDSLFISSIEHFYKNAEKEKNNIWDGMKLSPVCLYRINGPAILYNHPSPPENFIKVSNKMYIGEQKEMQLYGATQMEINGILTAIIDYGQSRYSCTEEVFAELFHELHHVYQRNFIKHIEFDNPAVLLTYPENHINDGLKLFEQKTLYKLCFERDSNNFQELLNQFYSCRERREQVIGDYLQYENTIENMEGQAFYCEYKFFNEFSSFNDELKRNYNERHFFGILNTPFYGRNSLRLRHLASGMAMCFILNKCFDNWQNEYYSNNLSLYEFFISKFNPQNTEIEIDPMYYSLSKFHTNQEIIEHQNAFNKFNSQNGTKITIVFNQTPTFKGFDPMHAESINDSTVLHKTLLRLSGNENDELFITNKMAITFIDRKIWFVKKVILYVPEKKILIKNNRIEINADGISVRWSGRLKTETENEILFMGG
jgi:hypothetical protein